MMELRHLRYFIAVAEELHFGHAAKLVHVAQPVVSQQIRQLEEEIGVKLFERTHHKVALTPAGKAFYENVRNVLDQTHKAVERARRIECGEAGTIRIGFMSSAGIKVLPEALRMFRQDVPAAEVELIQLPSADQVDALYREQIDIGFLHGRVADNVLSSLVVNSEKLMVAVPASCNLTAKNRIEVKDLAPWPAIMPSRYPTSGFYEHVRSAYEIAGITPERVHYTRLLPTGLFLVSAGVGVSMVPECFKSIRVQGVVYKKLAFETPRCETVAAWRKENTSPFLRRFIQSLLSHA